MPAPATSTAAVSAPYRVEPAVPANRHPFRRTRALRIWFVAFFCAKAGALALLLAHRPWLACLSFFSAAPWLMRQIFVSSAQQLCPTVTRFSTPRREVWLTIDDGPDPGTTPRVLDLLDTYDARATFFVIGEKVARHPGLVAEILRRGHTVANHTHTHPCNTFWYASTRRIATEIDRAADALREAGAPPTTWVRTPVGLKTFGLHRALHARDAELIGWTARGFDTISKHSAHSVERIVRDVSPGAIVLIHESGPPRSRALKFEILERLLRHLSDDGYTCAIPAAHDLIRHKA